MDERPPVVLDTNILVAAGFARDSASAEIAAAVEGGAVRMIWNDATRREVEYILRKIPPLRGMDPSRFFRDSDRSSTATHPERYREIADPDDRVFAALAAASGAILVSNDAHLLEHRQDLDVEVLTAGEFRDRWLTERR